MFPAHLHSEHVCIDSLLSSKRATNNTQDLMLNADAVQSHACLLRYLQL